MQIKILNNEIQLVTNFLMELELKGKESRMRTRFVRMMQEHYDNVVSAESQQLIEEYAEKDENDEFIMEEIELPDGSKGTKYQLREDSQQEYREELEKLMTEVFVIEKTGQYEDMLNSLEESVLNYDGLLSGLKAIQYDRICDIFEGY